MLCVYIAEQPAPAAALPGAAPSGLQLAPAIPWDSTALKDLPAPKYQQQKPLRTLREDMFLHCCCLLKDAYFEVRLRVWCFALAQFPFAFDLHDDKTTILEGCGVVEVIDIRGTGKAYNENLS